jgi:protein-S-isoprenylcysteine O-methyltransferase Ste14
MALLKTFVFTIFVPGTVTVVLPFFLLTRAPQLFLLDLGGFRYLALLPILFGAVIYLWSAGAFSLIGKGTPAPIDEPKLLVVSGPYRWTRNPMYVAVLSVLSGEGLLFGSGTLFIYAGVFFLIACLFVLLYEEPHLLKKYGESYREYSAAVPRWISFKRHG